MNLYIDCEWNDWKGELISIALCAPDGREFYEVTHCDNPSEWVAQNVMPILGKEPITIPEIQKRLRSFLRVYDSVHIVADWPEDIAHFCFLLIDGAGSRIDTPPLTMEVIRRVQATSDLPHNALYDARGIMAALEDYFLI